MGIIIKDGVVYGNNEPHPEFIEVMPNAGFHNSIFRGKYLGTSFTEAQSNAIKAGTFEDLFVGDYWTINRINWRIADFDTYYRCGDTSLDTHHIVVVPDIALYYVKWNETATTSGGYIGSDIRNNINAESGATSGALAKVISAFGDSHVLSYRAMYPSSYTDGVATASAWTDARVELMSENEVFGAQVCSIPSKWYEVGISKRQFSLFRLAPEYILVSRYGWWLRNVASNYTVAYIFSSNYVGAINVSGAGNGVRPFALIA